MRSRLAELDLSLRAAARASGGRLSHGTIGAYADDQYHPSSMTPLTIEGLALALKVSEKELRRRASLPASLGRWEPPAESELLSYEDRALLDALVKRLVAGS